MGWDPHPLRSGFRVSFPYGKHRVFVCVGVEAPARIHRTAKSVPMWLYRSMGSQERRDLGTGAAWDWEHRAGLDIWEQGIICGCSGTSSDGKVQPALGQSPQALQTFPRIFLACCFFFSLNNISWKSCLKEQQRKS